jgi:Zn-dependent protease
MEILFFLLILIFSVVLHETAHGYAANYLGDPTARLAGRLTLNPIPHIDPFGSVILPGLLLFSGSPFLFGWAKPVPYNPYNLRNQRWGEAFVAGAGPLVNIFLAFIFGLIIRSREVLGLEDGFVVLAVAVVVINVVLAIVNLIPIPPIDGSKILKSLLPFRFAHIYQSLEQMTYRLGSLGLIAVLLLIIFVFGGLISGIIFFFTSLFTGLAPIEIGSYLAQVL